MLRRKEFFKATNFFKKLQECCVQCFNTLFVERRIQLLEKRGVYLSYMSLQNLPRPRMKCCCFIIPTFFNNSNDLG